MIVVDDGLSNDAARVVLAAVELTAELCHRLPLDALKENLTALVVGLYPVIEGRAALDPHTRRPPITVTATASDADADVDADDGADGDAADALATDLALDDLMHAAALGPRHMYRVGVPSRCRTPAGAACPPEVVRLCEVAHARAVRRLCGGRAAEAAIGIIKNLFLVRIRDLKVRLVRLEMLPLAL